VTQLRLRGVYFPIMNRGFVHANLLSHLGLEQAEVQPALADMATDSGECLWMRSREGFWGSTLEVAKGQ
jgi:hypothetical protein